MKKLIFVTLIVALAAFAASNVFHVTFENAAWLGATQIKPGDYKITVENGTATFKSGKTVLTAPATIETAEKTHSTTAVLTIMVGDKAQLQAIEIGGSKVKIVIGQVSIPTGS